MFLVFYSIKSEDEGKRILPLIRDSIPEEKIRGLRTLVGLASYLKNFPSPNIALLLIANQEELASVLSLRKFLQNTEVILILPDRSEVTLRLAAALSPLLACFRDSSFSEVVTLMARLNTERQIRMRNTDPQRYCWSGTLPYIASSLGIEDTERFWLLEGPPH